MDHFDPVGLGGESKPNSPCLKLLQHGLDLVGVVDPTGVADALNGSICLAQGDYAGAAISAAAMIPLGGDLAKGLRIGTDAGAASARTIDVIVRKSIGADGASSRHLVERVGRSATSVTHQVVKDGQVVHQHQTHIGKYGTRRQFPDEWIEFPTLPGGGR